MKKYIIPTAETVALHVEDTVMTTASLNSDGGDNTDKGFRPSESDGPDEFDTNKKNDNPFDASGFWK